METAPVPALTPTERRALKARAHALEPVVLIGDKGLSPAVLAEVELALAAHELIKIRVAAERAERVRLFETLCARTRAAAVQHIGRILVLFRPKPPDATPRKAAARTSAVAGRKSASAGPRKPDTRGAGPRKIGGGSRPGQSRAGGPAIDTGRRGSRSASPRRAPAPPPRRRRTSR